MTVLVTGAAGFLGREVVARLQALGEEIHGADIKPGNSGSALIDVSSAEFTTVVEKIKPRVIVHLAGVQYLKSVPRPNRKKFFQDNVDMAKNLAKSIVEQQGIEQVVFVSSDMVYGKAGHSPISIHTQPAPIGPYGESKLLAEKVLTQAAAESGVQLAIFRPRLIAGAGRLGTLETLHKFMVRDFPVPIIGKGFNRYQFVSKNDVADAIFRSLKRKSNGVYNLGSEEPPAVRDLLSSAMRSMETKSRLIYLNPDIALFTLRILDTLGISPLSPEQFEIASLDRLLDTSDTTRDLGWQPSKTDLEMLLESFDYLSKRL